jgi:uncharacterized protein (DUF2336 family)
VAERAIVSSAVAEELLQTDNGEAVARLVANPGADLTEPLLETAATRFASDKRVTQELAQRPGLPLAIAERLVAFTAETLRSYISTRTDMPEAVVTQMVLRTREQVTVELRSPHFPAEEAVELVKHLHDSGRLTASLILRAVCIGDMTFFEAALAQLSGVAVYNARMLIHDAGQLGFQRLYERAGLPVSYLKAFRIAVQVAKETDFDGLDFDRERHRRTMIERILTQFEDIGAEDLDYLLIRLDEGGGLAASADHA